MDPIYYYLGYTIWIWGGLHYPSCIFRFLPGHLHVNVCCPGRWLGLLYPYAHPRHRSGWTFCHIELPVWACRLTAVDHCILLYIVHVVLYSRPSSCVWVLKKPNNWRNALTLQALGKPTLSILDSYYTSLDMCFYLIITILRGFCFLKYVWYTILFLLFLSLYK